MVPVCYPSKISSTTGLREAVVFALSSVTGLVRWSDYIPVKLVASADAALEGRTDAGGFIPMDMLSSNTGLMGWVDYLPVYVDNSATDAWAITATGFIPYAASGGGSSPAFTVTMTALSNALGTVTTLAYINPGSGGGGGGGGSFTPNVQVSRTTLKAGGHVYFDAYGALAAFSAYGWRDCTFEYDFGDDVGEYFANGSNLLQNKNKAYSHQAAHVYPRAGTFTWTVTMRDPNGNTGTATGTITVSAWTMAETIYISKAATPTVDGVNVLTGAAGYYQCATWTGTNQLKARLLAATGKRVLLDNSSSWDIDAMYGVLLPDGVHVEGYGSGRWELVTPAGTTDRGAFLAGGGCDDVRVIGGKHSGDGATLNHGVTVASTAGAFAHFTMHNMECVGVTSGVRLSRVDNTFTCVSECNIHDLACTFPSSTSPGIYAGECYSYAIIGNRVADIPGSHAARVPGANKACISNNLFQNPRSMPGGSDATVCHNLTLRGFSASVLSDWSGIWTEGVCICDNAFITATSSNALIVGAASATMLHMSSQNANDSSRLRNIIVERNFFDGDYPVGGIFNAVSYGSVIRNNIFRLKHGRVGVEFHSGANTGAGITTPDITEAYVYNNTFYKTTYNGSGNDGFSTFTFSSETTNSISGVVFKNNLAYAPNDLVSSNQVGPPCMFKNEMVSGASLSYTESNNTTDAQIVAVKPWASTDPTTTYTDYAPNGYGLNGGASVPVVDDFLRNIIAGTREMGAIQV